MPKRQGRRKATSGNFDAESLKIYFKRVINLEKEKAAEVANFKADIRAVYAEAKEAGFSTKILRGVVAAQLAPAKSEEDIDLENIYRDAIGLTPIETAIKAAAEEDEDVKREGSANGSAADPASGETVDGETGEVVDMVAPSARDIVKKIGNGRVAIEVQDGGGFKIDRSGSARGSIGKLLDHVHDALVDAGFTHHSGGVYRPTEVP